MRKKIKHKRATRKRSFLLVEILLSLALIALCLFPLIKPHVAMHLKNREYIEQIQFERMSQEAFCLLKEKLYANREHTWDQLRKGTEGELGHSFTLCTGKGSHKEFICHYTIRELDHAKKPSFKKVGSVLEIDLNFSPTPLHKKHSGQPHFQRTLYIERCEV